MGKIPLASHSAPAGYAREGILTFSGEFVHHICTTRSRVTASSEMPVVTGLIVLAGPSRWNFGQFPTSFLGLALHLGVAIAILPLFLDRSGMSTLRASPSLTASSTGCALPLTLCRARRRWEIHTRAWQGLALK